MRIRAAITAPILAVAALAGVVATAPQASAHGHACSYYRFTDSSPYDLIKVVGHELWINERYGLVTYGNGDTYTFRMTNGGTGTPYPGGDAEFTIPEWRVISSVKAGGAPCTLQN